MMLTIATLCTLLSSVALGAMVWLSGYRNLLPPPGSREGMALLAHYYTSVHQLFFVGLGLLVLSLGIRAWRAADQRPFGSPLATLCANPIATAVLVAYGIWMVQESSWFYKEILTWYDDVLADQLLNNFSLREAFLGESLGRNDYRFFPLSHQDLHLLSWFTPYTKVWGLVSAMEWIATVLLIDAIASRSLPRHASVPGSLLITTVLYGSTSAAAYNYFQFIYSERLLSLLLALYVFLYQRYQQERQQRDATFACLVALIALFLKDIAILLVSLPPLITLIAAAKGWTAGDDPPLQGSWRDGSLQHSLRSRYPLELALLALVPIFLAGFLWLSALPSLYIATERYDAGLRFASFQPDWRWLVLALFLLVRLQATLRRQRPVDLIDSLNASALVYSLALYALVGFESRSYMALPVQLVVVLDLLIVWHRWLAPRLGRQLTRRQTGLAGAAISLGIVALEHTGADTFLHRQQTVSATHRSWEATFRTMKKQARKTREKGETVNIIYSKSWFKHSDQLKTLPYDRLIYLDPDTHQARVIDGINGGSDALYTPQAGDFLLDLDSGHKLDKYKIDLSPYELIYRFDPNVSNGRIFRHR
jgi:hypothetical protein